MDCGPLISMINSASARRVAIDGCSASGKSSLAAQLAAATGCEVIHMDDFFLPPHKKTALRLSEPGGNVDYERFWEEAGSKLESGCPFTYNKYSCKSGALTPVEVKPNRLTVVEGVYCLHPHLRNAFDLRVFVKTTPDEQLRRILERNGPVMLQRFINEWIPLENAYFQHFGIEQLCDLVLEF